MSADPIVNVDSIAKRFDAMWAVRNLSFEIPTGQIFCLLGPSGSGKTTTIRILLALYTPDEGEITVFGQPPASFGRSLYKRIGYMPQQFVLYPTLTVEENLNFVGQLYGMGLFDRRRRIGDMLEFMELEHHRRKAARNLSSGMQRRLALAAALLHEPVLLILDEPTAGIDPILRTKFWQEFARLNDAGTTLIVTTQYVSEAENAHRVGILSEGALVALDTPTALRRRAFGGQLISIQLSGLTSEVVEQLKGHPQVVAIEDASFDYVRMSITDSADAPKVASFLENAGVDVDKTTELDPPFDDAFVRLVKQHRTDNQAEQVAEPGETSVRV